MPYRKSFFFDCGNKNGQNLSAPVCPGHCAPSELRFPAVPVTQPVFVLPFSEWEQQWVGIPLGSALVLMDTHTFLHKEASVCVREKKRDKLYFKTWRWVTHVEHYK